MFAIRDMLKDLDLGLASNQPVSWIGFSCSAHIV